METEVSQSETLEKSSSKSKEKPYWSFLISFATLIGFMFVRKQKQITKMELTPNSLKFEFKSPDSAACKFVHDGILYALANYTKGSNDVNTQMQEAEQELPEQTRVLGFDLSPETEEEDNEDQGS